MAPHRAQWRELDSGWRGRFDGGVISRLMGRPRPALSRILRHWTSGSGLWFSQNNRRSSDNLSYLQGFKEEAARGPQSGDVTRAVHLHKNVKICLPRTSSRAGNWRDFMVRKWYEIKHHFFAKGTVCLFMIRDKIYLIYGRFKMYIHYKTYYLYEW